MEELVGRTIKAARVARTQKGEQVIELELDNGKTIAVKSGGGPGPHYEWINWVEMRLDDSIIATIL